MSRAHRSIRLKIHRTYSVDDLKSLYNVCANTVSNWVRAGLRPVDKCKPYLFNGAEVKRFHNDRRLSNRRTLLAHEFRCFTCRMRVVPVPTTVRLMTKPGRSNWAKSECPDCGQPIQKAVPDSGCNASSGIGDHNTSRDSIYEPESGLTAGIGKCKSVPVAEWNAENERIIHDYQIYCEKYSEKTTDQHLASVRDFEARLQRKSLRVLDEADVNRYREHLKRQGQNGSLSASTLRHRASHLAEFLGWLVTRQSCSGLSPRLADYIKLPKGQIAPGLEKEVRAFPTVVEVQLLLTSMPRHTLIQRRDLAIVAASFLFGTRANATASLRIKSIDVVKRGVDQDARLVRAKNGKSQRTFWFPSSSTAEEIVTNWIEELGKLRSRPKDALFPPDEWLESLARVARIDRDPIAPWKTDDRVRKAFFVGCWIAELPYFPPHSARHHIKHLADSYCSTAEQWKAWSHNLGHAHVRTTEMNYGKMTDLRCAEVFALFDEARVGWKDMQLLLDYYEQQLTPGTQEFVRADRLALERRQRRIQDARRDRYGQRDANRRPFQTDPRPEPLVR